MAWLLRSLPFVLLPLHVLAAGDQPATFYRGINLNGPPLTIEDHAWDGNDAADFQCNGAGFENQAVPLHPAADGTRAQMLRSSRWGGDCHVELLNVPAGTYQVRLYVWEDNDSTQFDVSLNGRAVLRGFRSGDAGRWKRLGPWPVTVSKGKIAVSARGGDANLSGIEVWSGRGTIPGPAGPGFVKDPTAEQLAFFESRIRPLLVNHCYKCHSRDAEEPGGGLLLDSRPAMARGGDTKPPVTPGDAEASLLMTAVRYSDPDLQMPPDERLSDQELTDLAAWITMGAPDPRLENPVPRTSVAAADGEAARTFWSFQPLAQAAPPEVQDPAWPFGDIDRFVLAKMESAGLHPAADADRRTWIRRATYDLTGLPPTPEEIEDFIGDPSAEAWEKVVNRLLDSPLYGERWGRHWLDVVRYADTAGDNSDFPIPQMYRYRNWVIEAFNRDLPFDQFVREQLAGDLLPADSPEESREHLVATGYIANARRFGSRVDDYPQHLTIEDTIDNVGRAFLGLTINCARCHHHKFDPIPTEDYYALYGIFQSTRYPWPGIELEQKQRDLVPLVAEAEARQALQRQAAEQERLDGEVRRLEKDRDASQGDARQPLDERVAAARKAAEQFAKTPPPFEQAYAVADAENAGDAAVQIKGDPARQGPLVHRRFLTAMGGAELPDDDTSSGRLQLAEWIVDRGNPLTPRVLANRIWLHHFGKGIVSTPNDFGRQGKPPTHPELLDWLAARLIAAGWSIKSLHREIMLSHTYRLASAGPPSAPEVDPNNDWLSAYPRHRLDAEAIRDTLLCLGGNLDRSPGGPHPFPPQSEWNFTQHNPFKAIYDTDRRSVYLMTQRIQRHPFLVIFDGPDPSASTPRRLTSTTPLQALYFLNDPFVHDEAARLAARIASEPDDAARLDRLYRLALGRPPDTDEQSEGMSFLAAAHDKLHDAGVSDSEIEGQSWQALVRVVFRLNEFVYVD